MEMRDMLDSNQIKQRYLAFLMEIWDNRDRLESKEIKNDDKANL